MTPGRLIFLAMVSLSSSQKGWRLAKRIYYCAKKWYFRNTYNILIVFIFCFHIIHILFCRISARFCCSNYKMPLVLTPCQMDVSPYGHHWVLHVSDWLCELVDHLLFTPGLWDQVSHPQLTMAEPDKGDLLRVHCDSRWLFQDVVISRQLIFVTTCWVC